MRPDDRLCSISKPLCKVQLVLFSHNWPPLWTHLHSQLLHDWPCATDPHVNWSKSIRHTLLLFSMRFEFNLFLFFYCLKNLVALQTLMTMVMLWPLGNWPAVGSSRVLGVNTPVWKLTARSSQETVGNWQTALRKNLLRQTVRKSGCKWWGVLRKTDSAPLCFSDICEPAATPQFSLHSSYGTIAHFAP